MCRETTVLTVDGTTEGQGKPPGVPLGTRRFLLLQGPHGPFFGQLADRLRAKGAEVRRIGFNRGDQVFWGRRPGFHPYRGTPEDWPDELAARVTGWGITDIAVYGDTRPVHAAARSLCQARGLTLHVLEEGYLRPWWVTCERGGSNGNSALMGLTVADMRRALRAPGAPQPDAPAHWGDLRQHMFYGALYHFFVLAMNRAYPAYRSHRDITVGQEFRLSLLRLVLLPLHAIERLAAQARIRLGRFAYHVVLLQLEHDASFRSHSPFASMADFVDDCLTSFAAAAPPDMHLVFKAHPLEDGRIPLARGIRQTARRLGIGGRVHFVRGGRLGRLLDGASGAVTVNSTSGQQALWRGLPLRALGTAVYDKPGLVSSQSLRDFFAAPTPPDTAAYRDFRRFLLETSQVPGGFYSASGRAQLVPRIAEMMLSPADPYAAHPGPDAAQPQHLVAAQLPG
jgi:capsular polysaccharide export protein